MMPAMGINIVLNGADVSDKKVVQAVFDSFQDESFFDVTNGSGKVISEDTASEHEGHNIEFDLSNEQSIKIAVEGMVGVIYYDTPDKHILLEQLVLMFSGYKVMDVDLADIMPVLEKGCKFTWLRCKEEECSKAAMDLVFFVLKGRDNDTVDAFLQITDASLLAVSQIGLDEFEQNVIMQLISTETKGGQCTIALFYSDNTLTPDRF